MCTFRLVWGCGGGVDIKPQASGPDAGHLREPGLTVFQVLFLWKPLKSGVKRNTYLRGRQICLDELCYLYEVHLLLPTPDVFMGQEAGLFKIMYVERTLEISLRKLRPEKLHVQRKLAEWKDLEFSSLSHPSRLNFPLHYFALPNFWKYDNRSENFSDVYVVYGM